VGRFRRWYDKSVLRAWRSGWERSTDHEEPPDRSLYSFHLASIQIIAASCMN
jgi:hypothetical protein